MQVLYDSVMLFIVSCFKERFKRSAERRGRVQSLPQLRPHRRENLGHHEQYGGHENNFGKPEEPSEQPIHQ